MNKSFIFKINLILMFFLSSCMVTINNDTYDLENQFDGEIQASSIATEPASKVIFKLVNLRYKGHKMFGNPIISEYMWDIGCDGSIERTSKIAELEHRFFEEGEYKLCVKLVFQMEDSCLENCV